MIAAGSVDSPARIQALAERGVWAFTIGTAALDGMLVDGAPLDGQLRARSTPPRRWCSRGARPGAATQRDARPQGARPDPARR